MRTKKFFNLKTMLFFVFIIKTSFTLACKKEFLRSYHLKGYSQPKKMVLEMCSGMELSCCRQSDQIFMYQQWKTIKTEKKLIQNYKISTSYFNDIMKIFLRANTIAESVMIYQKKKQFSNCKTMAERITSYDLKDTYKDILKSFKKLNDFFMRSYKGFFCSICDAVNHLFIDDEKAKIFFSKDFCRTMITDVSPALIYMHYHIPVLGNLVGTFLNSCNKKGDYGVYKKVPKKATFIINRKTVEDLDKCKASRNERNWFLNCKDICQKFNFTNLTTFFIGDLKTIYEFNKFSNEKLHQIEGLKGKIKKKKFIDIQSTNVFNTVDNGMINLSGYSHIFVDKGFTPYYAGTTSMITKLIFDQVKNALDYNKKQGIKELGFSLSRKSIYIFGIICFLMI